MNDLNVAESLDRIHHVKHGYDNLIQVLSAWKGSGGIDLVAVRHPERAMYVWNLVVHAPPDQDPSAMAGDIVQELRAALDGVAIAICRAAGSTSDDVAFPIVKREPQDWPAVLDENVPGVWAEAADALKASQPFAQEGAEAAALPTLRALGQHRALALCARAAFLSAPTLKPGKLPAKTSIGLARADGDMHKGPLVPIDPGTTVEVARVTVQPDPSSGHDDVYEWSSGIRFDEPAPPDLDFGFRASNGVQINLRGLHALIQHVDTIVKRFDGLPVT
ncbi:MAG: hypothetical protein ABWY93_28340 [Mycobacterium sp.]